MANVTVLDLSYDQGDTYALNRTPVIGWDTKPPLAGAWVAGDRIYNPAPVSGGSTGWICKTSGSPGLWVTLPETVA